MGSLGADADTPRPSLARGTRARVRVKLVRPTRPPQRVDHRTGASDEPPHGSSTPREPAVIVDRAKHSFFTPTNARRKQVLQSKRDTKARGLSHDLPKQSSFHRRMPERRRRQRDKVAMFGCPQPTDCVECKILKFDKCFESLGSGTELYVSAERPCVSDMYPRRQGPNSTKRT